ncbi:ParA family protein [Kitasatospora sp. NPDC059646]|uniref:ParA family protein n=1 Tax=Kitasatospora sp. NPDC059646 TaxID=3346893 RepID=UPI0036BFA583
MTSPITESAIEVIAPRMPVTVVAAVAQGRTLGKTRVIVFALKAGGTAKTSSCTSLAAILGERGYRVLVIDLDPQGHASTVLGYGTFAEGQLGITDVIKDEAALSDIVVPARYQVAEIDPKNPEAAFQPIPNVYVAPVDLEHPELDDPESILNDPKGADAYWIRDGLAAMDGQWDVVLIDCPATYGRITVTAFVALDDAVDGEVLPPVLCTYKEAGAVVKLEKKLKEVRELPKYLKKGIQPRMKRVLVCAAPNSSYGRAEHFKTLAEIQEEYGDILLPLVHWSGEVPKIYRQEVPVSVMAPNSRPAQEYRKVATALGFPRLNPSPQGSEELEESAA